MRASATRRLPSPKEAKAEQYLGEDGSGREFWLCSGHIYAEGTLGGPGVRPRVQVCSSLAAYNRQRRLDGRETRKNHLSLAA